VAQPALPAGAKAAEAAAASAIGTLQIAVKPWGEVLVDGGSKGVSPPLKQLKLAAGKHKVEFANPGFPSYATEIEIQKGRSVTVSYQFK
jgi:aspartate/methionine/tyrosine aminotransferase